MRNEESNLEKTLNNTNFKEDMIVKLESHLSQSEKELIYKGVNEIIQSNNEQDGMDIIFDQAYQFINENLPDNVNAQLYKDIIEFINANNAT